MTTKTLSHRSRWSSLAAVVCSGRKRTGPQRPVRATADGASSPVDNQTHCRFRRISSRGSVMRHWNACGERVGSYGQPHSLQ